MKTKIKGLFDILSAIIGSRGGNWTSPKKKKKKKKKKQKLIYQFHGGVGFKKKGRENSASTPPTKV